MPSNSRYFVILLALAGVGACQRASSQAASHGQNPGAEYYRRFADAEDLAKKEKFTEAAAIYDSLARLNPGDAEIWLKLGRARGQAKQYREAADAYSHAMALGGEYPGSVAYRIARDYGLAGDKPQAFAWIEKALAIPLENRPRIADDDAFAAWRDDPAFRKLAGLEPKGNFTREQEWNYDLDFLVAEIRRLHFAYRDHPLPEGFENQVKSLRQRIPQIPNALMIAEVQRLLARLGDGHTGVQDAPDRIPVRFYDFSDGMFVTDAPPECNCIGDRVIAIGSTPIKTAVEKITPFLSVDNSMGVRLKAPMYLRYPDYLRAAGILSTEQEVAISLDGPRGKHQYTATASGRFDRGARLFPSKLASAGRVPRYLQHLDDNYTFETLPDGRSVYFQFNQVFDDQGETIEQFAPKLRAALAPARIRNLIVDVRHNTGGNLNLFAPLMRSIIAFETTHDGAAIYLLTSRTTFSAAQVFVNELDHYTSAIVAGEPSGSKPNFIGESAPTKLPFSGLDMTISTRYHQTDDQDQRTWIAPKIPVELSSADYFANRDPVMEAVLEVIKSHSH